MKCKVCLLQHGNNANPASRTQLHLLVPKMILLIQLL